MSEIQPSTYNFLRLPPEFSDLEKSRFVVIQVPFDSTASYTGGARNGPHAIIRASREVELFDRELGEPYLKGIATLEEIDVVRGDSERMIKAVSDVLGKIAGMGKIPVMLGGEHTITIGASMVFNDAIFVILDAHADLRDEYEGCKVSHACTSRRIAEGGHQLIQLGVRTVCKEEMDYLSENEMRVLINRPSPLRVSAILNPTKTLLRADRLRAHRDNQSSQMVKVHFMDDIRKVSLSSVLDGLKKSLDGKKVYLSIDIDSIDPSEAPGTGTPEPGGFGYREALQIVKMVCQNSSVVGFDVVEVSPIAGSQVTESLAARLAYKAIGHIVFKKG